MKIYKILPIVVIFLFAYSFDVLAESKFNNVWIRGWLNTSANSSLGTSNILFVDNTSGNVGIGTTSPNATFSVKVGGTTIADEWTVRSDKTKKKDISEFNSDNLLSLPFPKAYTYKMQWEEPIYNATNKSKIIGKKISTGEKTHLGLFYDEAPEILRGNNNGIDLYAFNTYNYMLIKELKQEIQAIETFLSDYEFNITSFPSVVKYRCASRDLEKECYQLSGGKNTRCYMTPDLQYGVYFICYEGWKRI